MTDRAFLILLGLLSFPLALAGGWYLLDALCGGPASAGEATEDGDG